MCFSKIKERDISLKISGNNGDDRKTCMVENGGMNWPGTAKKNFLV